MVSVPCRGPPQEEETGEVSVVSVPYRGPPQEEETGEVFFTDYRGRSLMVEGPGTHGKFYLDIYLTCRAQTRTQEFGKPARGCALQDLLYINKEELVRDVTTDGSLHYVYDGRV